MSDIPHKQVKLQSRYRSCAGGEKKTLPDLPSVVCG